MKPVSDIPFYLRYLRSMAAAAAVSGLLSAPALVQAESLPAIELALPAMELELAAAPSSGAPSGQRRPGPGGALYIAGDGFSLDKAVSDGLRENPGGNFAVLVLGPEIPRLGLHGITSESSAILTRAFNGGGVMYLCERDMKRLNLNTADLVPGVLVVRGFTKAEAQSPAPGPQGGAPLAPMFRMRQICAT